MSPRSAPTVEILEARIAPAAVFVSSTSATYTDADGDLVTVKFTKPLLTAANVGSVLVETGGVLRTIDLTGVAAAAAGTGISLTAKLAGHGDGFADVGYIKAGGLSLGAVALHGDLGAIDAGTGLAASTAVATLNVTSLGMAGLTTGAPDLISNLSGSVNAITLATDLRGAQISVGGALKMLTIGGSLVGGSAAGSGSVFADSFGPVKIGGDLRGGSAQNTGLLQSISGMSTVTIGGSVLGGAVRSSADLGAVKIGGDLAGGSAAFTGVITSNTGTITSVAVGGSLLGGGAADTGEILAATLGPVTVAHDVRGGSGASARTGLIKSTGALGAVTVGGSLLGGGGMESGAIISASDLTSVKIGVDVHGGSAARSGLITAGGALKSVTIGGSLIGTGGASTGALEGDEIGPVKITGDMRGGAGMSSGTVFSFHNLASITVGGALLGGGGPDSGQIIARDTLGSAAIAHDLRGGTATGSGQINATEVTGAISVGGSLVGGPASKTGFIYSDTNLPSVKIGRDLIGGSILEAVSATDTGAIETRIGRIGSVTIGGSLRAGTDASSGTLSKSATIRAGFDLGGLTVGGSLIGSATTPVSIVAFGAEVTTATSDLALKFVTVGGRVENAEIIGGYDFNPNVAEPFNPDAQIGPVKVGGNWIASRLAAGTALGADGRAGTDDDTLPGGGSTPLSTLASVTIGGHVRGTFGGTDSFRFMAEKIGPFKVGGVLIPSALTDLAPLGITGDVHLARAGSVNTPAAPVYAAPSFVNSTTATYTDVDGDLVTVKFTNPILSAANVGTVLVESNGKLSTIDLTGVATAATGTGVSVTAKQTKNGDGFANVGYLLATGIDLGAVTIHGDLGAVKSGKTTDDFDANGQPAARGTALKSLIVSSLGAYGTATGSPSLFSNLAGTVGPVTVQTDVVNATFFLAAGKGGLASFTAGGSVLGGAGVSSGRVNADTIGAVKIGGDLRGGGASGAGLIIAYGSMGAVTIGGSVLGGQGQDSGEVFASGTMGAVKIGGDVVGGGGDASYTGKIFGGQGITSVTIGGSLVGGNGMESGEVWSVAGPLGAVSIAHDIRGGLGSPANEFVGVVRSGGTLASLTVGGSLVGGPEKSSGSVFADDNMGAVKVGHDLRGGTGGSSGAILSFQKIASATIGGSIVGGSAFLDGHLNAGLGIATIKIAGDLVGGVGEQSGSIGSEGGYFASVSIGGSLRGGAADYAGSVFSSGGSIGTIKITGDVLGGTGGNTANIYAGEVLTSATVGGSVRGGSGIFDGFVGAGFDVGSVTINGSLLGGTGAGAGSVSADNRALGNVTIGGSVRAGEGVSSGFIRAATTLGNVIIRGDLLGTTTHAAQIIAGGLANVTTTTDVVIKSLQIGGSVEYADLLAGLDFDLNPVDGHAQIGAVTVGRTWLASNLAAGIQNLGPNGVDDMDAGDDNLNFGDSHDAQIPVPGGVVSKIASITIGGQIRGTTGGSDHFGFVSREIGACKVGGTIIPVAGTLNRSIGTAGDVNLHEV